MRIDHEPKRTGVKVLTHNTLFNRATAELGDIVREKGVGIVCLQEVDSKLPDSIGGLMLAGHIMQNRRVGLATYHDPDRWQIARVSSHQLTSNRISEAVGINPSGNRLLVVRFTPVTEDETQLVVGNEHGGNLVARKNGRVDQFIEGGSITRVAAEGHGSSGIMVSDSNLPQLSDGEIEAIEGATGLRYAGPQRGVSTFKEYPPIFEQLSDPDERTFDRGLVTQDLIEGVTVEVLPRNSTSSDHIPVIFSI